MQDILEKITSLRLRRNWTEYELAKNSGVPQSTISTWYRKNQTPTIQTLEKVCAGLGLTLCQFFADEDDAISLTPKQKELLDHWSALNPRQQDILLELLKNM